MISVQAVGRYPGRVGGVRYWTLALVPDAKGAAFTSVKYGESPAGYASTAPALALFPGRYELDISVSGRLGRSYFRVQDDGTVVDASALR